MNGTKQTSASEAPTKQTHSYFARLDDTEQLPGFLPLTHWMSVHLCQYQKVQ